MFTCSYDGRVLELDSNKTSFSEVYNNGGEASLFDICTDQRCSAVYLAREDGCLSRFDLRSSSKSSSKAGANATWQLHEKKINTVKLRPTDEYYLTTASLDRTVALFDVRKLNGKPLHVLPHGLSVNESSFSPDGKTLCSVCQDHKIRCYDVNKLIANPQTKKGTKPMKSTHSCAHDNRTGRWLTKFKVPCKAFNMHNLHI